MAGVLESFSQKIRKPCVGLGSAPVRNEYATIYARSGG
jgi:hypothetical protein